MIALKRYRAAFFIALQLFPDINNVIFAASHLSPPGVMDIEAEKSEQDRINNLEKYLEVLIGRLDDKRTDLVRHEQGLKTGADIIRDYNRLRTRNELKEELHQWFDGAEKPPEETVEIGDMIFEIPAHQRTFANMTSNPQMIHFIAAGMSAEQFTRQILFMEFDLNTLMLINIEFGNPSSKELAREVFGLPAEMQLDPAIRKRVQEVFDWHLSEGLIILQEVLKERKSVFAVNEYDYRKYYESDTLFLPIIRERNKGHFYADKIEAEIEQLETEIRLVRRTLLSH